LAKVIPIEEVIKANKKAGQFWFSPATLEFFQSQVSPWAVKKNSKAYFISAERRSKEWFRVHWGHIFKDEVGTEQKEALYTIREADLDTGNIRTIGEFQEFDNLAKAKKKLKELVD